VKQQNKERQIASDELVYSECQSSRRRPGYRTCLKNSATEAES